MNKHTPLVFFIDVDDTFVRTHGSKRIPIPEVIAHLKTLKKAGAILYCWRAGGAEYARSSAVEFDIEALFASFLPKPHVIIDDVNVNAWRNLIQVHPNSCVSKQLEDYATALKP